MKTRFTILLLCASALAMRAQDAVITMAGMAQVSGATNGTGPNALFGDPAGIVADSVPASEYEETLSKAKALIQAANFREL